MYHPPAHVLPTILCVASASLLLVACGGSSSSSTSSAAKEQQAEVKFADFTRCLREHGIEATTATGPNGGHGLKISGNGAPAKMQAAQTACKKYQPEPQKLNLSPQEKVQRAEAVEKFAKCMREHGIELHASSNEGRIQIQVHAKAGAGGPNPESPAFQKAQSSCRGLLPNGGPKGALRSPGSGSASSSPAGAGASSEGASVAGG